MSALAHGNQRALLTLGLAAQLLACGGHAEHSPAAASGASANGGAAGMLAESDAGNESAGTSSANGGGTAVSGTAGGAHAGGTAAAGTGGISAAQAAADAAVANAFLKLWEERQNEREPGSSAPSNTVSAYCMYCIDGHAGGCAQPGGDECGAMTACVQRHCLCMKQGSPSCTPQDYPSDLVACINTCLPPSGTCYRQWLDFTACENAACTETCTK